MGKKGKLIILEGADGAGKGTQYRALKVILKKNNLKFSTYDFPRYETNFWAKLVGKYLSGEYQGFSSLPPHFKSMLFLLDQADAAIKIRKDIQEGKIVLCNRYITSNILFQTFGIRTNNDKNKFINWLEQAAYKELGAVKPDVVIGLYLDPEVSFKTILRKSKRKYLKLKRDINEKNFALQTHVAEELKRQSKKRKDWKLINVQDGKDFKQIDDITNEIIKILKTDLKINLKY